MSADKRKALSAQSDRWLFLIWPVLVVLVAAPLAIAANSPLLEWRQPVYIISGFAGIVALALLLFQPLLVAGYLPGMKRLRGRRAHFWLGGALVAAVALHVAGLWITSPPDVIDALLLRSPTPFSLWGVIALWALLGTALVAIFRQKFRRRLAMWRLLHTALALAVVTGTVIHAVQIDGTMGTASKILLCVAAMGASVWVVFKRRSWEFLSRVKS